MADRKRESRLDVNNPIQQVSGNDYSVGGIFELDSEQQIHFRSLIRYGSIVGLRGDMQIDLKNLSANTEMTISNVSLNGTGVFLESSLLLEPGKYSWTSKMVLGPGVPAPPNPTQTAFAKIETGAFTMSTAGRGDIFSLVSARQNRAVTATTQYYFRAASGQQVAVSVSAMPFAGGTILKVPDSTFTAPASQDFEVDSGPLNFYFPDSSIYAFKPLYQGGAIEGVYLNINLS